jgi:phenylacetate-coenzyme A ligase PaaK-like adenylate-forming protein
MKVPYNKALINPENILNVGSDGFGITAIELFKYQYAHNELYRQYCDALHIAVDTVKDVTEIPFLPISFFKTHQVLTAPASGGEAALIFESSGTTGENTSRHYVWDKQVYETSLLQGFEQFYGQPSDYAILALLPSYLERTNASLVYMAKTLMAASGHAANGFYIDEWEVLQQKILQLESAGVKTLLLGVTFALLDFAEAYPMQLRNTIVMETGGMKGRKKEMTRAEVHEILGTQFGLKAIHSEYGMTELLSQAYSAGRGIFKCTNSMQVLVRDVNDPLDVNRVGTGALNVIDLANVYSCAFIATEDIGTINADGTFEVLGRLDNSALRGCSLMVL